MLPSRINAGGVENFGQENLKEHVAWVRLAVDRQYLRQYLAILSLWNSIPSAGASFREAICGGSTGSRLVYMTPNNLVLATGWKKQTLHNRFVSGLELWNGKQDGESAKSWEDSTGGRGGCVGGGEWQNWQLFVAGFGFRFNGSGLWRVRLYWWVFVLPWLQIIPTEVVARLSCQTEVAARHLAAGLCHKSLCPLWLKWLSSTDTVLSGLLWAHFMFQVTMAASQSSASEGGHNYQVLLVVLLKSHLLFSFRFRPWRRWRFSFQKSATVTLVRVTTTSVTLARGSLR